MANWKNGIRVNTTKAYDTPASERLAASPELIAQLIAAGNAFAVRTDSFAAGKAETCGDIANKLKRFGSFASDKQREFALKLIEWSKPRERQTAPAFQQVFPKLHTVLQQLADLRLPGELKLSRKNQDTLVWVMFAEVCVGKLEDGGRLTLFRGRIGDATLAVTSSLQAAEQDPLEAAKQYGRMSGRCGVCGRDLTDPESIAAGIGPVCASRMS